MIPTRYKSKLSHLMSYPVSAGKLSEALENVPQFDNLSVAFFDSCQHPSKLDNPCQILRISYSKRRVSLSSSKQGIEQGWYGEKWGIIVYPVPRAYVSAARHQVSEQGFQQMRQWRNDHKGATGKEGNCWLRLLYDLEANQLSSEFEDNLIG